MYINCYWKNNKNNDDDANKNDNFNKEFTWKKANEKSKWRVYQPVPYKESEIYDKQENALTTK